MLFALYANGDDFVVKFTMNGENVEEQLQRYALSNFFCSDYFMHFAWW